MLEACVSDDGCGHARRLPSSGRGRKMPSQDFEEVSKICRFYDHAALSTRSGATRREPDRRTPLAAFLCGHESSLRGSSDRSAFTAARSTVEVESMVPLIAAGLGAVLLGLGAMVDLRSRRRRRRQGSDSWADAAEAQQHRISREGYGSDDLHYSGSDGG